MAKKYLIAWEDEKGRRNWEMVRTKRERGDMESIHATLDGAGIAIQYIADVTSVSITPSLLFLARKANPRVIDCTKRSHTTPQATGKGHDNG